MKVTDEEWQQYVDRWKERDSIFDKQPCIAEQAVRRKIIDEGLPPGTPVIIGISCPCPRCRPVFMSAGGAR